MVNDTVASNRATFVLPPPPGTLVGRDAFLANVETYRPFGYTEQFIWYAYETHRFVPAESTWASCTAGVRPAGVACPVNRIDTAPSHTVGSTFGGGAMLHLYEYGGAYLARACGNFRTGSTPPLPIPSIAGRKFHDTTRDGSGSGEPGLGGWTIVVTRTESFVGQGTGEVGRVVTAADGTYRYALDGQGPGVYSVEEVEQPNWTRTTARTRTVVVNAGVGDHTFAGNDFGNVEATTDVVKVSFDVLNAPARIEADQPTDLTVRAVLRNEGPADPVDVEDVLSVFVPQDCFVAPERQAVRRRLFVGIDDIVDLVVTVTCTEPSHHGFRFVNDLTVLTPMVTDVEPGNNHRETEATIPVFDRADVHLDAVSTTCDDVGAVDVAFRCTVNAMAANDGPHAAALSDVAFGLVAPQDCAVAPVAGYAVDNVVLTPDPTLLSSEWSVTCADRSFHAVTGSARVTLDHLHVEDPSSSGNADAAVDTTEVFEEVDLVVETTDLTCSRASEPGTYTCDGTTGVANLGPADAVRTTVELSLSPTSACTATPSTPESHHLVLAVSERAEVEGRWNVVCTPASDATLTFATVLRNADDEPHAVDRDSAHDTVRIKGGRIDVKPRSFPSSVNPGKEGAVPVAMLSSADFDAWAEIDQASLRFGATGVEDSLLRCGGVPEDVDDDGRGDLVCQFDARSSGLRCSDLVAVVTGKLIDGALYEAVGEVNVVPCRK